MAFRTEDKDRAIAAMERILQAHAVYEGPPTFAYRVGAFVVDRDGNISSGDEERLGWLKERLADGGALGCGACAEETFAVVTTASAMRNIINMIYSKQHLIGKAAGYPVFGITEELVAAVKDRSLTAEEILGKVEEAAPEGIKASGDVLAITGLPDTEAYRALARAMADEASSRGWILPDEADMSNEKYVMRAWLVRMGLGGKDAASVRKTLMMNLGGNSAFRTPEKEAEWKKKHQNSLHKL
ncbi:MAG: hypothetical protein K6F35_02310 [Lachnospiraceae bacterium]|nr:hypothetical protein [Lachnospiraceae bacterium]